MPADKSKSYECNYGNYGNLAIGALGFQEKMDDPVRITVFPRYISGATVAVTGSLSIRDNVYSEPMKASLPSGHVIHSIQVCTNDPADPQKRKLKGVRIWGRRYDSDGGITEVGPITKERTNCKKWHPKVSCKPQEVAVGLRAHYQFEQHGFRGLSMLCQRVAWQ